MAGRRNLPPADKSLCRRCQSPDTAITARTEPLCKACFDKYVQTKVVKRMKTFRVKNSEPGKEKTLLLPLSFGPCSTALVYTLSRHLKNQIDKSGRPGFKLHVLHIDAQMSLDSFLFWMNSCSVHCANKELQVWLKLESLNVGHHTGCG